MRKARWISPFLGILAAAVFAGCSPTEPIEGGTPNPKPVKTIVSLSPSTSEVAAMAGLFGQLKGRTAACNYPTTISNVPVVAEVKPNYEQIAQIKPDIVLYDPNLFSEADVQKLKDLGTEPWPFTANTFEEYKDSIYKLGSRVGAETNLSSLIDRMEIAKNAAIGDPLDPQPTTVIILPGSAGSEHMIAGTKSFPANIVGLAGGKVLGPDSTKFEQLNAEQLVSWNPDVIIVAGTPDNFLKDSRFASLKAIAEKKVGAINQDVVVRAGSRVDKFIEAAHGVLAQRSRS